MNTPLPRGYIDPSHLPKKYLTSAVIVPAYDESVSDVLACVRSIGIQTRTHTAAIVVVNHRASSPSAVKDANFALLHALQSHVNNEPLHTSEPSDLHEEIRDMRHLTVVPVDLTRDADTGREIVAGSVGLACKIGTEAILPYVKKGGIIARTDADSLLMPGTLASFEDTSELYEADVLTGDILVDEEDAAIQEKREEDVYRANIRNELGVSCITRRVSGACMAFTHRGYTRSGGWSVANGHEDSGLVFSAKKAGLKVAHASKAFAYTSSRNSNRTEGGSFGRDLQERRAGNDSFSKQRVQYEEGLLSILQRIMTEGCSRQQMISEIRAHDRELSLSEMFQLRTTLVQGLPLKSVYANPFLISTVRKIAENRVN